MPLEAGGIEPPKEFQTTEGPTEGPESLLSTSSCGSTASSGFYGKACTARQLRDMGSSKYELEDYIYEMEYRQAETAKGRSAEDETTQDVYTRLSQKEDDLILAAELGKALLERNEVLVQQNEKLAEDYSHKLEVLEQEKHSLRRKFTTKQSEYESRMQELAFDLQCTKHEVEDNQDNFRQTEREKAVMVEQLTEQNHRLTNQIKEASKNEEQLNQQIQHLREQFSLRRSNMSDQVTALDMLKDEIGLLSQKKFDLEHRIESLAGEREGLSVNLDESTDKILILERQSREKEQLIRNSQRDLEDLRHTNLSLSDRLEAISRNSSSPSGHTSLMNEMDLSDQDASRPSLPEDLLEMEEEFECDDPVLTPVSDAVALKKLRNEMLECTSQLRSLVEQMRQRRCSSTNSINSLDTSSSDEMSLNHYKPGLLKETATELKSLVRQILRRGAKGQCGGCGREDRIAVEQQIHRAAEAADKLKVELADVTDKLKAKTEEAAHLEQQIILKDAQTKAIEEERDNLKFDLNNTHLAKDELIKKAWDMRDQAVARKNNCEIDLARAHIDVMQVNSQLMEAVQQKVELSQQLEQWQVDMQQLLDDQMRRKLERLENSGVFNSKLPASDSDSSSGAAKNSAKRFKIAALLSMLRAKNPLSSFTTASAPNTTPASPANNAKNKSETNLSTLGDNENK